MERTASGDSVRVGCEGGPLGGSKWEGGVTLREDVKRPGTPATPGSGSLDEHSCLF